MVVSGNQQFATRQSERKELFVRKKCESAFCCLTLTLFVFRNKVFNSRTTFLGMARIYGPRNTGAGILRTQDITKTKTSPCSRWECSDPAEMDGGFDSCFLPTCFLYQTFLAWIELSMEMVAICRNASGDSVATLGFVLLIIFWLVWKTWSISTSRSRLNSSRL